jgi:hypothetical protein
VDHPRCGVDSFGKHVRPDGVVSSQETSFVNVSLGSSRACQVSERKQPAFADKAMAGPAQENYLF